MLQSTLDLVFVALLVAPGCPDHELHRVLLVAPDVAVAHEEQFQHVLPDLQHTQQAGYEVFVRRTNRR